MASRTLLETIYQRAMANLMDFTRKNPVVGKEAETDMLTDRSYWAVSNTPASEAADKLFEESLLAKVEQQGRQITNLTARLDRPELYSQLIASADEARAVMAELGVPDEVAERLTRSTVEGTDEEHDAAFADVLRAVLDRIESGELEPAHT